MNKSEADEIHRRSSVQEPRLIDRFTPWCKIRYRWQQLFARSSPFLATLCNGQKIRIRPDGTDWSVAIEVFAQEVYRLPKMLEGISVQKIVDIGGNVGYTSLYLSQQFPKSQILAFEPHPANIIAFREHMSWNRVGDRVELLPFAAGIREDTVTLNDCGSGSSMHIVRDSGFGRSFEVRMIDWIAHLGDKSIDLLKIDIEGGEYELIEDARFELIRPKILVMEWHTVPGRTDCGRWCLERLGQFGYQTLPTEGSLESDVGMIWAVRG
jgi:FkbM family methyltransferase